MWCIVSAATRAGSTWTRQRTPRFPTEAGRRQLRCGRGRSLPLCGRPGDAASSANAPHQRAGVAHATDQATL